MAEDDGGAGQGGECGVAGVKEAVTAAEVAKGFAAPRRRMWGRYWRRCARWGGRTGGRRRGRICRDSVMTHNVNLGGIRTFALVRRKEPELTGEHFAKPKDFDLDST